MAKKTNYKKNGKDYYRISKVVGHKLNSNGVEVPVRKEFYGASKKEAEDKYASFMRRRSLNLNDSKQYFGIMAEHWIYDFLIHDSSLKNSTITLYLNAWNTYVKPSEIYNQPLDDISAGTIQKLYNTLFKNGCPSSQIKAINKMMSRFYNYLVQQSYVPYNFISTLTIPKEKSEGSKPIITWDDQELSMILNGFEKAQKGFRLRFLIQMATFTGLRISELLGLKYEDIEKTPSGYVLNVRRQVAEVTTFNDDGSKTVSIEATSLKSRSAYRTIPLSSALIDEFKRHRRWHKEEQMKKGYRTDYIFTTDSGNFYYKKNVRTACERYYKNIGVPNKGMHTYRHTFGTNLYRKGVPLKTASDLLGHSDISTTAKYYIGTREEEKRKAIEMLADIV